MTSPSRRITRWLFPATWRTWQLVSQLDRVRSAVRTRWQCDRGVGAVSSGSGDWARLNVSTRARSFTSQEVNLSLCHRISGDTLLSRSLVCENLKSWFLRRLIKALYSNPTHNTYIYGCCGAQPDRPSWGCKTQWNRLRRDLCSLDPHLSALYFKNTLLHTTIISGLLTVENQNLFLSFLKRHLLYDVETSPSNPKCLCPMVLRQGQLRMHWKINSGLL